jgi:hypothetical protein
MPNIPPEIAAELAEYIAQENLTEGEIYDMPLLAKRMRRLLIASQSPKQL